MQFGMTCAHVGEIDMVADAERLGYDYCWATDSPLLRSNPWSVLALAARETHSIRLGTGVVVPGLRDPADTANGIATIARLAPGRAFLGIGTGNTAMRTLGRRPMRVKPFAEYTRMVAALIRGETVDYESDDGTHPVRFHNLDLGYVDVSQPIPVHVGGFGPRAQSLAGEIGDGLITGIPRGGTVSRALANARRGAARVGRSLEDFTLTALMNVVLLEPGETLSSERVVAECGSAVMANVHYLVDLVRETGNEPPAYVLPIWEEYVAFARARDAAPGPARLHESHYSYLDPEEARFVTPEMIRAFCLAGQPDEIVARLRELEAEGLDAVSFIPPDHRKREVYGAFGREVIARL